MTRVLKRQHIPNIITAIRILLIPVIIVLMYPFGRDIFYSSGSGTTEYHISIRQIIAGILFIIAVVSDLLDGMLARRWDAVSKFGKFFDSIADKLLCNAVIIMMAVIKVLPAWLAIILVSRDFYLDLLRQILGTKNIVLAASQWGRVSAAIKMVALIILFFVGPWQFINLNLYHWINQICLIPIYIATLLTLTAAFVYTKQHWSELVSK